MLKKINLQTKLFMLLSGLTASVLLVVLFAVNQVSSNTIEQKVLLDFRQLQSFFKSQQALRYDRLVESAILIAENSTFKGNVQTGDPNSVAQVVNEEYSNFVKSDLMIVTDEEGSVLAWYRDPDAAGRDLSERPSIQNALAGYDPEINPEWPDLWFMNNELYQIVSVPIFVGSGPSSRVIGTLTIGSMYGDREASALKQESPLDIILFHEQDIIGSSFTLTDTLSYQQIAEAESGLIDSLVTTKEISSPKYFTVQDEEQLSFISPLGHNEQAYYIATIPVAREFQALSKIQNNIILIALITLVIIIPLAMYLGSIISSPIKRLTDAMLKVEEGNLDISLEPRTNDEIGMLTVAFNKMTVGLRERFALTKYVGDHTLDMIQKNKGSDVPQEAGTEHLAILFTDIRGSTQKIESSEPKEFIRNLNATLSAQSQIVLKHKGSIDKFVGDSVIALFSGEDGLVNALNAAVEIQQSFRNDTDVSGFFEGLGIGVNEGEMVLGNMGANERMDYTVIGSQVNLCARLCSAAEASQILIPEELAERKHLGKSYAVRPLKSLQLKGFNKEINVAEVQYED